MRTQKRDVQLIWAVLEEKPQREGSAALEEVASQLPDSETKVTVRLAEACSQLAQRQETVGSIALRQLAKTAEHLRIDTEQLSQASS